jgi:hypothetical protein
MVNVIAGKFTTTSTKTGFLTIRSAIVPIQAAGGGQWMRSLSGGKCAPIPVILDSLSASPAVLQRNRPLVVNDPWAEYTRSGP